MEKTLENNVETLADRAAGAETSHEAMQYAQAALNVAHALQVLTTIQRTSAPT